MDERHFDQGVESFFSMFGRITQSLEENADETFHLWIADDLAETLQTSIGRKPNFFVAVV